VAAVGPATAAALGGHGIVPDFVPDEYVGEGLLEGLCLRGVGPGTRILLPRALEAREVLPEGLRERGARVDVVPAYRTVPGAGDPTALEALKAGEVDAVTFTSSSTVKGFLDLVGETDLSGVTIAAIGPVTAETARAAGLEVAVEPAEYTVPALVEALGKHFG
jgi:uroporphyrinogen III methyltransferase/synthase